MACEDKAWIAGGLEIQTLSERGKGGSDLCLDFFEDLSMYIKKQETKLFLFWKLNCLVSTCSSNPSRRRQSCFHILLSVLAGRYYSEPGQACKLVWRPLSVWDAASKSWSAFAGKLVPSRADNEKRFTHLQLFVAKHVAISKLVWQRSHNDRRVMGPQLPPTVKVGPGLNNLPRTNSSQEPSEILRVE